MKLDSLIAPDSRAILLAVIFAFDEIGGLGDSFPGFRTRKQDLNKALLEISERAGDRSHVSGPVNYLVRITTAKWMFNPLPAINAFVIVDNVDNIAVLEKVGGGALQSVAVLTIDDDWFEQLCGEFTEFRERIDE